MNLCNKPRMTGSPQDGGKPAFLPLEVTDNHASEDPGDGALGPDLHPVDNEGCRKRIDKFRRGGVPFRVPGEDSRELRGNHGLDEVSPAITHRIDEQR